MQKPKLSLLLLIGQLLIAKGTGDVQAQLWQLQADLTALEREAVEKEKGQNEGQQLRQQRDDQWQCFDNFMTQCTASHPVDWCEKNPDPLCTGECCSGNLGLEACKKLGMAKCPHTADYTHPPCSMPWCEHQGDAAHAESVGGDKKMGEAADPSHPPPASPAGKKEEGKKEEGKKETGPNPLEKDALEIHNSLRAKHGAPPLKWMPELAEFAGKAAAAANAKGEMFHSEMQGPSGQHGQNAYWSSAPGTVKDATQAWYDELHKPGYDFTKPGFSAGTGHFTQVVWKGTTHVGMAIDKSGLYIYANYFPAGNFMGKFPENVLPEQ